MHPSLMRRAALKSISEEAATDIDRQLQRRKCERRNTIRLEVLTAHFEGLLDLAAQGPTIEQQRSIIKLKAVKGHRRHAQLMNAWHVTHENAQQEDENARPPLHRSADSERRIRFQELHGRRMAVHEREIARTKKKKEVGTGLQRHREANSCMSKKKKKGKKKRGGKTAARGRIIEAVRGEAPRRGDAHGPGR